MLYGRSHFNFVFIGAGSSVFTMGLVGDILMEPCIQGGELRLVDVDADVLAEVERAVSLLIAHTGADFVVRAYTDFHAALPEADFVFLTYAVGGINSWKKDIEVCTRYGVLQSVGDTIGPGAIIRILRSIPVALDIAKEMERVCPEAYVINYTNPEGAQCLAIEKYSSIRTFGLCHGTPDTADLLASEVFKVERERFSYEAAGINHLTWFTSMRIDGRDVYPTLAEHLQKSGYAQKEQVSWDLYRVFGLYPAPGDRHVEEFFSAFLKPEVIRRRDLSWKNNDFIVVEGWRKDGRVLLEEVLQKQTGYDAFLKGSGETATHFIRALVTGDVCTEMVNVQNRGYIENLSDGVIVELPAFVDQFGIKPQHVGKLPAGIAAKLESLAREYMLLVDAVVESDLSKILEAVYLDPLCANCDDPEGLIMELIHENRNLLTDAWRNL